MSFTPGTFQSIHSISQKSLAQYWQRLGNGTFPPFEEFHPNPRMHDAKQLAVWNVERHARGIEFRALYRGSLLDEAFNSDWVGRTLAEVTPPSLQAVIVEASTECVRTGCAIYSVLRTRDGAGHSIDLERLLLPFGRDGLVQQVVASLQLISLQGDFQRKSVLQKFEATARSVLSIQIPSKQPDMA